MQGIPPPPLAAPFQREVPQHQDVQHQTGEGHRETWQVHIIQITEATVETEDEDDTDFSGIFKVFSTECPWPKQQQVTAKVSGNRTHLPPQPVKYQSYAEDPALISEL